METGKFVELLMQIPLAGVNILVVVLFLKYLEKSDERQRAFMSESRKENNEHISLMTVQVAELHKVTMEHHTVMIGAIQEMRMAISRHRDEVKR
jgi:hypothetical protein